MLPPRVRTTAIEMRFHLPQNLLIKCLTFGCSLLSFPGQFSNSTIFCNSKTLLLSSIFGVFFSYTFWHYFFKQLRLIFLVLASFTMTSLSLVTSGFPLSIIYRRVYITIARVDSNDILTLVGFITTFLSILGFDFRASNWDSKTAN